MGLTDRLPGAGLLAGCLWLAGCASQIVLVPEAPDGSPTTVAVTTDQGDQKVTRQGYALYTDPVLGVVYRAGDAELERDFGPSLEALRDTLATGLPELPHSYLVLLPHPRGPLGSLTFEPGDGRPAIQLAAPAEAAYIDGYPERPPTPDAQRLTQDFGPALVALRDTLKLMRSYLMLLESPDGESSQVVFRSQQGEALLESPGECLTLDGLLYLPDEAVVGRDFADSREATRQILAEGLPRLPHSYTALLASPQGPVGEVEILEGEAAGVRLDQANQAVIIDGYSENIYPVDEARLKADFGDSLAALPPSPVTLTLYFPPGSTALDHQARKVLAVAVAEIRKRTAADVTVAGHADTVSDRGSNERLSRHRAQVVAQQLRRLGAPAQHLEVDAYGETLLAVTTPDNRPEARNRRVEITVR